MKLEELKEVMDIPAGVTVTVQHGVVTAKGPKGQNSRNLFSSKMHITHEDGKIILTCKNATKREKTMFYTTLAHAKNIVKGAAEGFSYKLKVCSGHFPMSVAIKGDVLEVKNFIGEAVPRRLKLHSNVKVVIEGQIITVEGSDIEQTGQQAAQIELLCRRVGFDRRVFQDGIYITHKGDEQL